MISNETPNPQTEYEKQKLEVERFFLTDFPRRTTILRLSKVLHPKFPLCVKWINDLKENKPIYPYEDLYLAPVFLCKLNNLLVNLIENPYYGILHFSGNTSISYEKVAKIIAGLFNFDKRLIIPSNYNNFPYEIKKCERLKTSSRCKYFVIKYPDLFKNLFID